jgi:hypothetical protein
MSIARDAILDGLFLRLKTKLGANVTTIGRRHMMPPTLTTSLQPALFVVQAGEHRDPRPLGTSGKVTMHALLIAYTYDSGSNPDGTTKLNILLGLIDDAIAPSPTDSDYNPRQPVQTLGGLARHVWIEGEAEIDPGVFNQQQVAIIPVRILVP